MIPFPLNLFDIHRHPQRCLANPQTALGKCGDVWPHTSPQKRPKPSSRSLWGCWFILVHTIIDRCAKFHDDFLNWNQLVETNAAPHTHTHTHILHY